MDFGNAAQIASALFAASALIISLIASRSKGFKDAIDAVRNEDKARFESWSTSHRAEAADIFTRLRHAEEEISAVKTEIEHLPDKDTAHRMEMAIARLEGRLETMDERLKPVASMAARMQDFILEKASS